MSSPDDQTPELPKELYESPAETEAAIERIHGHFRSVRKVMADEKTADDAVSQAAAAPEKNPVADR